MEKIIIAAVSENGVIGNEGKTPWHSSQELAHFQSTTLGYPVLMGRKTFQSLKAPLLERKNLVLTKNPNDQPQQRYVNYFNSVEMVLDFCNKKNFTKLFIIGGGEVYLKTMYLADKLLLSKMKFSVKGDTYFPDVDPKIWNLTKQSENEDFILQIYLRI